jgi:hypothetical protein
MTLTLQQKIFKAQVWAISTTITHSLNFVVMACVLNQSKGHLLFLDALTTIMNLIVPMESKANPLVDDNETLLSSTY